MTHVRLARLSLESVNPHILHEHLNELCIMTRVLDLIYLRIRGLIIHMCSVFGERAVCASNMCGHVILAECLRLELSE